MSEIRDTDQSAPFTRQDPPLYKVLLWPNRSLPQSGFQQTLLFTAFMLSIPLIPLLGTPVAWALLPFLVATLLALWYSIKRNYKDGELTEELRLWPDFIAVVRREPRGKIREWSANPYWVTAHLHKDARLENYLTLKGNGREIELGAFLSPEERATLYDDITRALSKARATP